MDAQLQLELLILAIALILVRVFYLVHKITTGYSQQAPKRTLPCRTIICVGSGGHTIEILHLLNSLDFLKYTPRYYVVAKSDTTSYSKIVDLEKSKDEGTFEIIKIPRSRIVNQSYFTSIFTTIYSTLNCIPTVVKVRPDLILCNGPGTCIPICLLGFLLKASSIKDTRIFFVESFCRTQTLSLSGKILMYFADNFVVQWPSLKKKCKRAEYIGQLM